MIDVLMELLKPIRNHSIPGDPIDAMFCMHGEPVLSVLYGPLSLKVDKVHFFRCLRGIWNRVVRSQGIQDLSAWHQVERGAKEFSVFKAWVHMAGVIQHLIKS